MPPHHRSRKSPGAQPLTSHRDQYRALMREGMSNAAASRIVGSTARLVTAGGTAGRSRPAPARCGRTRHHPSR